MDESEKSLRSLFAEALEITDASQRGAFLTRACGPDANLRREVEELLQAEADAGKFLPDRPAAAASRSTLQELAEAAGAFDSISSAVLTERPGDRIGRYELVEKIGEGGCGVVYLAQQETPVRRQVALKIIKLGMDTRQVIARFEAERQALAMMDHPSIARVLDAGATDTGRPYFVMELVRGSKITDYCNQHQLSTRERLELFIQVCQAMQHAHQKGIIHRDLKPSNILVTCEGAPVPKVIDFGIAKATEGRLTDQTLFTAFEQFLGTPAYMSPEQAAMTNVDIDTRSDIYSLGVLLYELLTGTTPFDSRTLLALGVDELRRTIREKEPPKPSTRLTHALVAADVRRPKLDAQSRKQKAETDGACSRRLLQEVRGDLDWIVMKCLEKDRARRYETANGLAADLGRHLNNEPVMARPPNRLYEFKKTVQRHRVGFAATAGLIVVLLGGVIVSTWEAIRAMQAEREQTRLRQQADAEAYTSDMNLAHQAWEEGNLQRARALLSAHIPQAGEMDFRGFEWRYLWNLCREESLHTVKFEAHDPVWKLATTPAHSFVAAACEKTIRLLDPSTGSELARFSYPNPEPTDALPAVALTPGRTNLMAVHRAQGVIGLWDLASRKLIMTFQPFTNSVGVLALSPDGSFLAVVDRDRLGFCSTVLAVWDISSWLSPPRRVWSHEVEDPIRALTFSPAGKVLVAARVILGSTVIDSWDVKTGHELKPIPNASTANVLALTFSPDGALLASGGVGGGISVWNFKERALRNDFEGHAGAVESIAFTPDARQLISGGVDGTIRRWSLDSGKANGMWRLPGHKDLEVVLAPDGQRMITAGSDEVRVWETEPRRPASVMKVEQGWGWQVISPDSKDLIVSRPGVLSSSGGASVWDIATGQHRFDLVSEGMVPQSLAFSPNGRLFAVSSIETNGLIALWNTAAWEQGAARVEPFAYLTNGFESASIRFSPNGRILAAAGQAFPPDQPKVPGGATNRLAFWEVGSWKRLSLLPEAGVGATEWAAAASVDFSPDGRLLAVGSRDGWARLWDFKQERRLMESRDHPVPAFGVVVTFSSDSRWLASYATGGPSVVLFDLADLNHAHPVPLSLEEAGGIYWALFAPDNKSLITADGVGLIKFWNLRTRKVALTLRHGRGPGGFLAVAPDGNSLVSKDANGVVKVWSAPTLAEIDLERNVR
jgi:eukaryotic-like serine/threonine-protein kinase